MMIGYDFVKLDCLTFRLWESGFSRSIMFENEHFWSSELLAGPTTVGAVYDRILPCKAGIPLVTRWCCIWQHFLYTRGRKPRDMPSSASLEILRILVECKPCTLVLGVRRVLGGGARLRFAQLHFMKGIWFLRSCEGRGGLWGLN